VWVGRGLRGGDNGEEGMELWSLRGAVVGGGRGCVVLLGVFGPRGVVGLENIGIECSFISPNIDGVKSSGEMGSGFATVAMEGLSGDSDEGDVGGLVVLRVEGETYECLMPDFCPFSACSCASAYFSASSWCTAREKRRQKSGSRTVPIMRLCLLASYEGLASYWGQSMSMVG
jgi:hypothetical protein